jgi:hypothetical protein
MRLATLRDHLWLPPPTAATGHDGSIYVCHVAQDIQRFQKAPEHRYVAFGVLPDLVEAVGHEIRIRWAPDHDPQLT